jgi:CDP-glucose 4,6-dehydratase
MSWTDAFRNRAVFVTGHTGFKGSWLALWLHRLGARITGYALPAPTTPSNFATSGVEALLSRHIKADVRDAKRLTEAMRECRPDVVFHLSAQALVRQSYQEPHETIETNVLGTANVLEALRRLARPCAVVIVTSDKCYENRFAERRHEELDPFGGRDPYSASKAAAEIVTESYRASFFPPEEAHAHGIKVATVRAGNAIGGGDWAQDRIVPDTIRALASRQPLKIRNPKAIRPWQHVLEPLSGYLMLAARMLEVDDPRLCGGWNFGPRAEDEATVRRLVDFLVSDWRGGPYECTNGNDREPFEESCLRLSAEKAKARLGWRARWRFEEAVRRTSRWYKKFHANPTRLTRDSCLQDIQDYETAFVNEIGTLQPALEHPHYAY